MAPTYSLVNIQNRKEEIVRTITGAQITGEKLITFPGGT
jgi:hypothetical protein